MGVSKWRVAAWLLLLGVLSVGVGATPEENKGTVLVSNEASDDGDADRFPRELAISADVKTSDIEDTDVAVDDNVDGSKSSQKNKFFFGSYQTMTHIIVTFDTTTVPLFCLSGTSATGCLAGRRRRKRQTFPSVVRAAEQSDSDLIGSSQNLESKPDSVAGDLDDGGKKFFTVWTKVLTTTTLTSTTTNSASTITLSYYCTAGSMSLPPLCG